MATLLFSCGNMLAMAGWLAMLVALFVTRARPPVLVATRFIIPVVFGLAYVALLIMGADAFKDGGFSSIAQVRVLFAHDNALTAGWLHYLAFDLFVGTWIVEDGTRRGVNPFLIVPCLILTFLFGPAGYLLYNFMRLTRAQHTD